MYHINSKVDRPNIPMMESRVKDMMKRGVSVGNLSELYSKFAAERDEIADDIRQNYGIQNPNSSQQILKYLSSIENAEIYEICCIDGKWTTNKDALGSLALLGYQFAEDILQYRKAKKYAESIKSMQDTLGADGRVHPQVTLSKTNRINYSSPALMNIPKPLLWHIIKANKPGNILISADIKNQEPSILINILGANSLKGALVDDKGLYEHLFNQPFKATARLNLLVTDGYKPGYISNSDLAEMSFVPPVYYTPSSPSVSSSYFNGEQIKVIDVANVVVKPGSTRIEGLPDKILIETVNDNQYYVPVIWDEITQSKIKKPGIVECIGELQGVDIRCEGIERKEFKQAWNAMTYGASVFGIRQMCKHIDGDNVYKYFSGINEFKKYRANCKKLADSGVQNIKTFFGSVLYAGESNPSKLRRVLLDLPIQGTASDILSLLIAHVDSVVEANHLEGKLEIYYTRHDEIIFEVDGGWVNDSGLENVKQYIKDLVEHQVDDWVPFKVEVKEVKADKLYLDDSDESFE